MLSALEELFDEWISRGMRLQNIDDAIAGCVLLRLAGETGRAEYLEACGRIYSFLRGVATDREGALCYFVGQGNDFVLVDGIGQASMFLYDYAKALGDAEARAFGLRQLELFLHHAIDERSGLPYHGYVLSPGCGWAAHEIRQGIIGWGRGVGWLLLGMSRYAELREQTLAMADAAHRLQLRDGLWAWQLGATGGPTDTSGTAMIAYSLDRAALGQEELVGRAVEGVLASVGDDGRLTGCLDDGRGISQHPQNYGHYPWGQGIALALLSRWAREHRRREAA
nr:glycoside hydrolase family 88 protein [Collinsella intestinalis]